MIAKNPLMNKSTLQPLTDHAASSRRTPVAVFRKLWLVVCLVALACSGCASYKEGGSRTVGEFTDDVGIQSAVKTALIRDKEISGLRINVEVNRSVVSLYGRIPSEYARQKAVRIAAGVRGVVDVQDRLTLVEE